MAPLAGGYGITAADFNKSTKGQSLDASTESLIALLKRRQLTGSEQCALATAHLLRQVVARARWTDVESLLQRVTLTGRRLVDARPQELVIGNVVRRILRLIRDEAVTDRNGDEFDDSVSEVSTLPAAPTNQEIRDALTTGGSAMASVMGSSGQARPGARPPVLSSAGSFYVPGSMFNLLSDFPGAQSPSSGPGSPFVHRDSDGNITAAPSSNISALRSEIIDGIDEIRDEIGQVDDQIAGFAEAQVHPGECVLVYKPNTTVERFLIAAAKRRKFTAVFMGDNVLSKTQEASRAALRKKLAAAGVQCITIRGGGVMAYMPRIQKVVLGARAVLADGSIIVDAGAGLVSRAAKEYGVSVLALAGVYKVCPVEEPNLDVVSGMGGAPDGVSFSDGLMVDGVDVQGTETDFVPPEQVSIYITNLGAMSRHNLQSIITEHYKQEDVDFSIG